ncbi:hypothetical protein P4O66_007317, partial [Electrophorus voltai]
MKHRPQKDVWKEDKREKKGKKTYNRSSPALVGKLSILLGTLTTTTGESAPGGFWGSPECSAGSDSAESYRPSTDYRITTGIQVRTLWSPIIRTGTTRRATGITSECGAARRQPLVDLRADSERDEPPVRQGSAQGTGVSKLPRVSGREVASSSSEDTPSPTAHTPRAPVPTCKPQRGKKDALPVPATETVKAAAALPGVSATKLDKPLPPELAKGDPPQAGLTSTQPTTGGQAGVPASFTRLFPNPLCGFVHVPVPVTLNVPVTFSPFVSVPAPVSVSTPVSVVILVPVFLLSVLLALVLV